jgi:DNA (cytosine-5)-methyltransferase 1
MKHLGDITKINGADIEPVECIIGGSPCQDLSIAGKRAGLDGERSGLFMEQIRIVKEMRAKYGTAYPRFMVWENVPGAFSSNKEADFAAVLTEIIRVVEPEAPSVDVPAKGWSTWGGFRDMDGRWSVVWRVHDAQYWGVPQRRRRIALVADFGGDTASEILFDRKSVSGDIAESGAPGQRFAETAEAGASYAVRIRGGCDGGGKGALVQTEKSGTLGTGNDQTIFQGVAYGICSYASNSMKSSNPHSGIYEAETARTLDGNGGNPSCNQGGIAVVAFTQNQRDEVRELGDRSAVVCTNAGTKQQTFVLQGSMIGREDKNDPQGDGINEDVSFTLNTVDRHAVYAMTTGSFTQVSEDKAPTVLARDYKDPTAVCYGIGRDTFNQGQNAKFAPTFEEELQPTLVAKEPGAIQNGYAVRRLTPTECERLQGFPDGWTDIGDYLDSKGKKRKTSDSARYKALGDSIALPFWQWMLRRMCEISGVKTMGSLFDGIGGFPLCWERINGEGSCRWASEIEEFPMAVTKRHFKEE